MKLQFAVLVIVVLAGFSFIGIIVFGRCMPGSESVVLLNTGEMIEADTSIAGSTMELAVIEVYPAGKEKEPYNSISMADAFVCTSPNKSDPSKTDTILLLDTRVGTGDIDDPTKFGAGVKPAKKLSECRVLIPKNQVKSFKSYKYKYGKVMLVTDD